MPNGERRGLIVRFHGFPIGIYYPTDDPNVFLDVWGKPKAYGDITTYSAYFAITITEMRVEDLRLYDAAFKYVEDERARTGKPVTSEDWILTHRTVTQILTFPHVGFLFRGLDIDFPGLRAHISGIQRKAEEAKATEDEWNRVLQDIAPQLAAAGLTEGWKLNLTIPAHVRILDSIKQRFYHEITHGERGAYDPNRQDDAYIFELERLSALLILKATEDTPPEEFLTSEGRLKILFDKLPWAVKAKAELPPIAPTTREIEVTIGKAEKAKIEGFIDKQLGVPSDLSVAGGLEILKQFTMARFFRETGGRGSADDWLEGQTIETLVSAAVGVPVGRAEKASAARLGLTPVEYSLKVLGEAGIEVAPPGFLEDPGAYLNRLEAELFNVRQKIPGMLAEEGRAYTLSIAAKARAGEAIPELGILATPGMEPGGFGATGEGARESAAMEAGLRAAEAVYAAREAGLAPEEGEGNIPHTYQREERSLALQTYQKFLLTAFPPPANIAVAYQMFPKIYGETPEQVTLSVGQPGYGSEFKPFARRLAKLGRQYFANWVTYPETPTAVPRKVRRELRLR